MTAQTKGVDVLSDLLGVVRIAEAIVPHVKRGEAAVGKLADLVESGLEVEQAYRDGTMTDELMNRFRDTLANVAGAQ